MLPATAFGIWVAKKKLHSPALCWRHEYVTWQRMEGKDWHHRVAVEVSLYFTKSCDSLMTLEAKRMRTTSKMASWKQDCWSTDVADGKPSPLTFSVLEPWGICGRSHRWLEANNKLQPGRAKTFMIMCLGMTVLAYLASNKFEVKYRCIPCTYKKVENSK